MVRRMRVSESSEIMSLVGRAPCGPHVPVPTVNVQAAVRVRPLSVKERLERERTVLSVSRNTVTLGAREYSFDRVFGASVGQEDVYKTVCQGLVDEVIQGYNCTIFAYGQTGTGKTYTMEGTDQDAGVIPRAISQIFAHLRSIDDEYTVRVSHLELYNEVLSDLLDDSEADATLRIYEDAAKGTFVSGLDEVPVRSEDEIRAILEKTRQKRKTAETNMNSASSRSHSVFTITIHIKEATPEGEDLLKVGKLNLVDLAGSENIGKSGAINARAREAGNINTSLLTLGRVITALVERHPHIPYRDSKLTRLLQESLGGRNKTCIIATVGPAASNMEETESTLKYANRAKSIKNRPTVNQMMTKRALIREYTDDIARLKAELDATRMKNGIFVPPDHYAELQLAAEDSKKMIIQMQEQDQESAARLASLEQTLAIKEATVSRQDAKLVELDRINSETNRDLDHTRLSLRDAQREIEGKGFLLGCRKETEQALSRQATGLRHDLENAVTAIDSLQERVESKRQIETRNMTNVSTVSTDIGTIVEESKDQVSRHQTQINELCDSVCGRLSDLNSSQSSQVQMAKTKLDQVLRDVSEYQKVTENLASGLNSDMGRESHLAVNEIQTASQKCMGQKAKLLSCLAETVSGIETELDVLKDKISDVLSTTSVVVKQQQQNMTNFGVEHSSLLSRLQKTIESERAEFSSHLASLQAESIEAMAVHASSEASAREEIMSRVSGILADVNAKQQESRDSVRTRLEHRVSLARTAADRNSEVIGEVMNDLRSREQVLLSQERESSQRISFQLTLAEEKMSSGVSSLDKMLQVGDKRHTQMLGSYNESHVQSVKLAEEHLRRIVGTAQSYCGQSEDHGILYTAQIKAGGNDLSDTVGKLEVLGSTATRRVEREIQGFQGSTSMFVRESTGRLSDVTTQIGRLVDEGLEKDEEADVDVPTLTIPDEGSFARTEGEDQLLAKYWAAARSGVDDADETMRDSDIYHERTIHGEESKIDLAIDDLDNASHASDLNENDSLETSHEFDVSHRDSAPRLEENASGKENVYFEGSEPSKHVVTRVSSRLRPPRTRAGRPAVR